MKMLKPSEKLAELIRDESIELKTAFDNYYPYDMIIFVDDVEKLLEQLKEEGK